MGRLTSAASVSVSCVERLASPRLDRLNPSQRAQVRTAGKRYDGRRLAAARRMEGPDALVGLQWRRFEGGKKAFDVLTYDHGDSGCVFRSETTRWVADIVQGEVDCKSAPIARLLDATLDADARRSG